MTPARRMGTSRAAQPARAFAAAFAAALGFATACGEVTSSPTSVPDNSCPAHPCTAYRSATAACVDGACLESASTPDGRSSTADLVLLVSTPEDAFYAPTRTFALSYDALRGPAVAAFADAGLAPPTPGMLPALVNPTGLYTVLPSVVHDEVAVSLGVALAGYTSLPFHASFLPKELFGADGTVVPVSQLPMTPVAGVALQSSGYPGPNNGLQTLFSAYLQPGVYTRTLTPDPPFDQKFGPSIEDETIAVTPQLDQGHVDGYDTTGVSGVSLPTAVISRSRGSFEGWTAYMRSLSTRTVISNVAPLHKQQTTVTFAVLRITPGGDPDALSDAQIVVAPPTGSVEPTYIGTIIQNQLLSLNYPTLPEPVTIQGTVRSTDGMTQAADLVFENIAIMDVVNGAPQLDSQSFELTRFVGVDPSDDGQFTVALPPGQYRVDVRPRDPSWALYVEDLLVLPFDPRQVDVIVSAPQLSPKGVVQIADGRPLANAVVAAVPVACAQPASLQREVTSPWCLPAATQTLTDASGIFRLAVDPGAFTLQVRPPAGSRLPWVIVPGELTATVGTVSLPDPSIVVPVPAPLSIGLRLTDPAGNPVPNALVRAFRVPRSQGTPLEVGESVAGPDGTFEMFVAPE